MHWPSLLCILALLLSSCGRREMSLHQACARMKDQTGFDPVAAGYTFRHRYFSGQEWTLNGVGVAPSAEAPDILTSLGLQDPALSIPTGALGILKTVCETAGTPDDIAILYDRSTRITSRASLRGDSTIYVAANREKHWFAISILHH